MRRLGLGEYGDVAYSKQGSSVVAWSTTGTTPAGVAESDETRRPAPLRDAR